MKILSEAELESAIFDSRLGVKCPRYSTQIKLSICKLIIKRNNANSVIKQFKLGAQTVHSWMKEYKKGKYTLETACAHKEPKAKNISLSELYGKVCREFDEARRRKEAVEQVMQMT